METPDFEVLNEETYEKKQKSSIYLKYFRAGGNWCTVTLLLIVLILSQASCSFGDWWLSYW